MKNKIPITEERYKQIIELEEFTNAILCIAAISKELINVLFKKHKDLNINIDIMEKLAWRKIRDGASSLDNMAFKTGKENYDKFKKSVCIVKFLLLELISRCDDSNMKLWQFHNMLKSYKVVYSSLSPTLEDEQKAFADLFEQ